MWSSYSPPSPALWPRRVYPWRAGTRSHFTPSEYFSPYSTPQPPLDFCCPCLGPAVVVVVGVVGGHWEGLGEGSEQQGPWGQSHLGSILVLPFRLLAAPPGPHFSHVWNGVVSCLPGARIQWQVTEGLSMVPKTSEVFNHEITTLNKWK